jgi:hypothetical protein
LGDGKAVACQAGAIDVPAKLESKAGVEIAAAADVEHRPKRVPPVQMRICARFRRGQDKAKDDLPEHNGHPAAMILRILALWPRMLFSRPVGDLP